MNITVNAIEKHYSEVTALAGPSFEIPSGSTFGVLGTNGAGKTTLFNILVGHATPDAGDITVGDFRVSEEREAIRHRIGYLPEQVGYPELLTGREVLELHARVHGLGRDVERIGSVLKTVGLAEAGDRRIEGYSNGMQRRLGLAAALLAEPPVLVLDEPTAGLDPRGVETFHGIIERIDHETEATVVLSSHVLSEVERICDGIAILHEGELCAAGPLNELTDGTAGTVSLRIVAASTDAASRVRDAIGPDASVDRTDTVLEAELPRDRALLSIGDLDPADVDHLDAREPGLEAVFHRAIGGQPEVSAA